MWFRRKTNAALEAAKRERRISESLLSEARSLLREIYQIRQVNHIAEALENIIKEKERNGNHHVHA
jgi:hypothetical protein